MKLNRKLIIGAAALLAVAGGGVAIAASDSSSSEDNQAILNDAAKQLGVSPSRLSDALKNALKDRIDAAVAAGRITKAEGDSLKQRIDSNDFPLFGGLHHGFRHFGFFGGFDAAASYLGLTEAQLRSELESGKTLAQVAQAHGKSVDGLVNALYDAAKTRVDAAVAAGRLTRSEADDLLSGLRARITELVNSMPPSRDHHGAPGFGLRHFGRGPI